MHPLHSQRKKPELLSPAGNRECFFAAVENGADAVYLGLNNFSARASAQNFSLDDAGKAIVYAHERSVKVYIALNTLLKTQEIEEVVDSLIALEEMQPDALILQDLGLFSLLQSQFPNFNLHASTQMAIHNLAGVRQLEKMGFKRVVLARELSIDEIASISHNTSVEIEVFVHGALCYSYSGLCFFSSMIGGRSGNRGRCAQPCRMYYQSQQDKNGYIFSMKDLMALSSINELLQAGIHSCKIEGRMKSPEYVAVVTNTYRQAIDGKLHDYHAAIHRIKTVFSRETTHSYLQKQDGHQNKGHGKNNSVKDSDVINPFYPANIGAYAGVVIRSEKGHITIKADTEIGVRDLLQIFENDSAKPTLLHIKTLAMRGKKVYHIKPGDIATINSERQYAQGTKLYVISSQKVHEMFAPRVPKKLMASKIPVNLEVKIEPDGIHIKGTARHFSYSRSYPVRFEKSLHKAIQEEDISECFSRLGETPFKQAGISADIPENLFVPLSLLNDIRRDYFINLSGIWRKDREQRGKKIKDWIKKISIQYHNKTTDEKVSFKDTAFEGDGIKLSVKIDRLDYLDSLPCEKISRIFILLTEDITEEKLSGIRDKVVFSLPTIMRDRDNGAKTYEHFARIVDRLISQGFKQFQISNIGAGGLFKGKDVQLYADYPMYCLNPLSGIKLKELGFHRYTLSPEDDKDNLLKLFSQDADVILYQDTPLFTSETCVWANIKGICPGKSRCSFKEIACKNEYGDRFTAINDECRTVVIHERPFSIIHHMQKLYKAGQLNFRIDLCNRSYTPEMVHHIFSGIQSKSRIDNSLIGNFERGLI